MHHNSHIRTLPREKQQPLRLDHEPQLAITEIYTSIQGESTHAGRPCQFIRLSGCPLRCRWCDTVYGFKAGQQMKTSEILDVLAESKTNLVEITGGEPLAQKSAPILMKKLLDEGYEVLLETSGSECLSVVPRGIHIIMDLKCPGSGMSDRNRYENISHLKKTDEIKFVIASLSDFDWAIDCVNRYKLLDKVVVLFSPAFGLIKEKQLSQWIIASGLPIRLNLQIHKYIWSPREKGV